MQPLKKQQIIGLFGAEAASKLFAILDPCCTSLNPCCPTEKYTITPNFVRCEGPSPLPIYTFKIDTVVNLSGFLGFTVYFRTIGGNWSQKVFSGSPNGISIDTGFLTGEGSFNTNTTYEIVVVDSRGNWSSVVTFTTNKC